MTRKPLSLVLASALLSAGLVTMPAGCGEDDSTIDFSTPCTTGEECDALALGRHASCTGAPELGVPGFCRFELPCPCSIAYGQEDCNTDADCLQSPYFAQECLHYDGEGKCVVKPWKEGYICTEPGHNQPIDGYDGGEGGSGGGPANLP